MRLRPFPAPLPLDILIAVAIAVGWVVEVGDLSGIAVASLALCTLPLGWRRVAPMTSLVLVSAGFVLSAAEAVPAEPLAQLVAVLASPYSAAVYSRTPRHAAAAGVIAIAAGITTGALIGDDVAFIAVVLGAGWAAGFAVRRLMGRSAELEQRAADLDEQARTAAADERARIARELHDVVSHSVSLMVVQAGAAEQVLRDDPERAAGALQGLQSTGRAAVDDLRRMLGLLRDSGEEGHPLTPQPGLAGLEDLIAGFERSGMEVELERRRATVPLPAGVDLTVFRIIQEGLTNSAKHARGRPVCVNVAVNGASVALEIRTRGAGRSRPGHGGHGLVGMRERVGLYGGDLHVGPEGGDWVVRASIPVPAT